jgi:hypothetical protein
MSVSSSLQRRIAQNAEVARQNAEVARQNVEVARETLKTARLTVLFAVIVTPLVMASLFYSFFFLAPSSLYISIGSIGSCLLIRVGVCVTVVATARFLWTQKDY